MPREQRTGKNQVAAVSTDLGTFDYKAVKTVNMPTVTPQKSMGQALAEGIGLAAKGALVIGEKEADERSRQRSIIQNATGQWEAGQYSAKIIDEAKTKLQNGDIVLIKKNETDVTVGEYFATALKGANDNFKQQDSVSSAYLDGYLKTLGKDFGAAMDVYEQNIAANRLMQDNEISGTYIKNAIIDGKDAATLQSEIKISRPGISNKDLGDLYVSRVSSYIKEQAQINPNFDWQTHIDKYLKIKTKDGINYADHPTYGAEIDKLETSLTTLATSRATAADKARKKASADIAKKAFTLTSEPTTTPETISEFYLDLLDAEPTMEKEDYRQALEAVRDRIDTAGFAPVSDTERVISLKQSIQKNTLTIDDLRANKAFLTQEDYLKLSADVIKIKEDYDNGLIQTQINTLNDVETDLTRTVAAINKDGFFQDSVTGPQRVTAARRALNSYVEDYRRDNDGDYPPTKELYAEADRIAQSVIAKYPTQEELRLKQKAEDKAAADVLKEKNARMLKAKKENKLNAQFLEQNPDITADEFRQFQEENDSLIDNIMNTIFGE